MRFSQVAASISESATLRLNQVAGKLRAEGEPVIHLGGGEPEEKASPAGLQAAMDLLRTGEVRYTPAAGTSEVRRAIAEYHERVYGVPVEPVHVIASSGAKQAIMVCMHAVLDPGDEVVFPAPYWVSYPEMVKLCGAVPVVVQPRDVSMQPALADFEARVTPRTRMILINSPCNPSGAMFSDDFIRGVVRMCEDRDIWLVIDDIYHQLVFDGRQPPNPYAEARRNPDQSRLVLVNGVSKTYAMTGFRLGWAVAARELITHMASIQGQQTSGASAVSQAAAAAALRGDQGCVERLRASLERKRGVMLESLRALPQVQCAPPQGTFYCFPDFSRYERDSQKLSDFLLEKVRVVTVPGREFGLDGHLRLSTCGSAEDIVEGVRRIAWALDPRGGRELRLGSRTVVRDW